MGCHTSKFISNKWDQRIKKYRIVTNLNHLELLKVKLLFISMKRVGIGNIS